LTDGGAEMTMVLKRNQSLQEFDSGKIMRSIEAAARDASLPEMRVSDLVERISRKTVVKHQWEPQVPTSAIREEILRLMDEAEPAASRQWRNFERTHKGPN
jgi:transcriptional regulator NrdR family protein